jgi:hypothetical protein
MIYKVLCVLLVSLTSLAFACEKDSKQQLLKMQQLWNSQNSFNYSYNVKKQCFCSPDYTREMRVLVVDNTVANAQYVDTNEKVSKRIIEQLVTVSEWFIEISKAADNELGEVEVVYDEMQGYPANIKIDEHKRRSDDEFTIIISKVTKQ